jgi:nitrous-oxide reductase
MADSLNKSRFNRRTLLKGAAGAAVAVPVAGTLLASCGLGGDDDDDDKNGNAGVPANIMALAEQRGLTPDDITRAVKTYQPSGKFDDFYIFASGGHSGQVLVIGVPSMRLLKLIAAFTPEPWQGYGFSDETKAILDQGTCATRPSPGPTHTTPRSAKPTASTTGSSCSSTTRPTHASP